MSGHPYKKMVESKVFNISDITPRVYGVSGHRPHGGSILHLVGPQDHCPSHNMVVRLQKIQPGSVQLYHYHEVREQVMICLEGNGTMLFEEPGHPLGVEYPIEKGSVFFSTPRQKHRTVNTSDKELQMLIIDAPHQREVTHNFDEEELKKGNLKEIKV
jgi:oxalate decarboxylase/phosphoglucose isomerase-like protein (cupin superfamily)